MQDQEITTYNLVVLHCLNLGCRGLGCKIWGSLRNATLPKSDYVAFTG